LMAILDIYPTTKQTFTTKSRPSRRRVAEIWGTQPLQSMISEGSCLPLRRLPRTRKSAGMRENSRSQYKWLRPHATRLSICAMLPDHLQAFWKPLGRCNFHSVYPDETRGAGKSFASSGWKRPSKRDDRSARRSLPAFGTLPVVAVCW
jgi:hypothetical protein